MIPWGLLGQGLKAGLAIYKNKKAAEVAMSEAALIHAEKMKKGEIEYTGKVKKVMKEFKKGELNIGKSKKKVKSRKQAIAIALSEAGMSKKRKKS